MLRSVTLAAVVLLAAGPVAARASKGKKAKGKPPPVVDVSAPRTEGPPGSALPAAPAATTVNEQPAAPAPPPAPAQQLPAVPADPAPLAQPPPPTTTPGPSPASAAPVAEGRASTPPPPATPLRIAVTDVQIKGEGIDPLVGESLSAVVAAEVALRAPTGARVISRNELKQLVGHAVQAQVLGCSEPRCLGDFGEAATADQLVVSAVGRVGDEWVLTLELIDVALKSTTRRQAVAWAGPPAGLVELVRPYVTRLMEGSAAETYTGAVEILAAESGAAVRVDDKEVGATPVPPVRDLPIGRHRVSIVKDGFVPFQTDVVVHRNESTLLQIDLVDEASLEPWYYKWWVWTAAGGVLAGGVAVALLLRPDDTTTLEVSSPLP